MELKNFFAQDTKGNVVPFATVTVYNQGTTVRPTIYGVNGSAITNPFNVGNTGLAQFRAANGEYDVKVITTDGEYTLTMQCNDLSDSIDELKSDGSDINVVSSTGEQTVVAALESRGAVFDRVADLDAATNLQIGQKVRTLGYYEPGDGGGNDYEIVGGATGTADGGSFIDLAGSGLQAKGLFLNDINVKQFGAKGDGVEDDFNALKRAIEYACLVVKNVVIPSGRYFAPYRSHGFLENWIEITSGIKIQGEGDCLVENMLFYTHGSYGSLIDVGATGTTTGDTFIDTSADHNYSKGDWLQLISVINSYTPDAGDYQMGSRNVTSLELRSVPLAEINRVASVPSSTGIDLQDRIQFPGYQNSTSGLSYPMDGISSARVRKLAPVENVVFENIGFKNEGTSSFRSHLLRVAFEVTYEDCRFFSGEEPGSHVKTSDCKNVKFIDCQSYRNLDTVSGSSWNTFLIGGGCEGVEFIRMNSIGESQNVDFTVGIHSSDVGSTSDEIGAISLVSRDMAITNSRFRNNLVGSTVHPGIYGFICTENQVYGCSTGFNIRARKSNISNNIIETYREGLLFSSFTDDSIVSGNTLKKSRVGGESWVGINIIPMSSETITENNTQNFLISNNVIEISENPAVGDRGILFRHYGNGVPPDPNLTEFDDDFKTGLSNYIISNNAFSGCGVHCERWINGSTTKGNTFRGGSDSGYYVYHATNSAKNVCVDNTFNDNIVTVLHLQDTDDPLTWPYSTTHRVENNQSRGDYTATLVNVGRGQLIGESVIGSGLLSISVTISDDSVVTIQPPRSGGFFTLTCAGDIAFVETTKSAFVFYDVAGSPVLDENTGFTNVSTGVDTVTGSSLSGTTGTDGNVTISAPGDGTLQIENRVGNERNFQITFM